MTSLSSIVPALQHRGPWKQSVLKAEAVQRCLGGLRWHRAAPTAGPCWVCASCCRAALDGDRKCSFLSPGLLLLLASFHSKPGCLCFFMPSPQEQSVVADLPCQLIKKKHPSSGREEAPLVQRRGGPGCLPGGVRGAPAVPSEICRAGTPKAGSCGRLLEMGLAMHL